MQIANSIQQASTVNGVNYFWSNDALYDDADFDGPLLDCPSNPTSLAQPYTYQGLGGNYAWRLSVGSGKTNMPVVPLAAPYMADAPFIISPGGASSLTVTGSFSDYLMYQPNVQGSVWIALSEIDWSWSESATPPNWPNPSPQPAPTGPNTPSGAACFPTWVNITPNFITGGWED